MIIRPCVISLTFINATHTVFMTPNTEEPNHYKQNMAIVSPALQRRQTENMTNQCKYTLEKAEGSKTPEQTSRRRLHLSTYLTENRKDEGVEANSVRIIDLH